MRRAILTCVIVATVVAVAQPAGAVDNGFRGRYLLIARQTGDSQCDLGSYRHRVRVRFVNPTVRVIRRVHTDSRRRLEYVRGERFPWQDPNDAFQLRYDRTTDS